MAVFSLALASLFVLYIIFVAPLLSRRNYQRFLQRVPDYPLARKRFYLNMIITQWLRLIVVGIIALLGPVPLSSFGLTTPQYAGWSVAGSWGFTLFLFVEATVLFLIGHAVVLRRLKKASRPRRMRLLLNLKELLPHTATEQRFWLAVSISAGVCEEIVFRGFLTWYFLAISSIAGFHISFPIALLFSTLAFAIAHLYQSRRGVLLSGLLTGGILALCYAVTGNLLISIFIHILIDVRAGVLAPYTLRQTEQENSQQENSQKD